MSSDSLKIQANKPRGFRRAERPGHPSDRHLFGRHQPTKKSCVPFSALLEGFPEGIEMTSVERAAWAADPPPPAPKNPPKNPAYSEQPDKPGIETDRTNLPEGPVVLQWPATLTEESVDDLDYWLKGVLRRARRKAGLSPDPDDRTNPRGSGEE